MLANSADINIRDATTTGFPVAYVQYYATSSPDTSRLNLYVADGFGAHETSFYEDFPIGKTYGYELQINTTSAFFEITDDVGTVLHSETIPHSMPIGYSYLYAYANYDDDRTDFNSRVSNYEMDVDVAGAPPAAKRNPLFFGQDF